MCTVKKPIVKMTKKAQDSAKSLAVSYRMFVEAEIALKAERTPATLNALGAALACLDSAQERTGIVFETNCNDRLMNIHTAVLELDHLFYS